MWLIFIVPVYIEHWKLYRKIVKIKLLLFNRTNNTVANKIIAKKQILKKKKTEKNRCSNQKWQCDFFVFLDKNIWNMLKRV